MNSIYTYIATINDDLNRMSFTFFLFYFVFIVSLVMHRKFEHDLRRRKRTTTSITNTLVVRANLWCTFSYLIRQGHAVFKDAP